MNKLVMLPGPTNVSPRVMQAMLNSGINHRGEEFHELFDRIQKGCQEVFQTSDEMVVLSASGTGGVDAAVGSILGLGDKVVVPSFGEFSSRLGDSSRYTGAEVIIPKAELGKAPSIESVEDSMKQAGNPKALCVVYNETSTGVTWRELERLKSIASKFGALFVVDAISVLGGDELPVEKLGVDICIAGSQKCLATPPGLVILSFSNEAKKAMTGQKPRNQYFDISRYFEFAKKHETPSTPSLPLYFALAESLKMIHEEGLQKRLARHAACSRAFYSAFDSLGLKPLVQESKYRSNVVIGINYPQGLDDVKFRATLLERFGIMIAGGFGQLKGKMFRVGCMGIIDQSLVGATVSAVGEAMNFLGHRCSSSEALSAAWEELKTI